MCSGLKRTTSEQQRMKKRIQRAAEQYFAHLETMDAGSGVLARAPRRSPQ